MAELKKGDKVRFAEMQGMNRESHFEWIARQVQPMTVLATKPSVSRQFKDGAWAETAHQLATVRIGRWPGGIVLRDFDAAWFELVK